MRNRAKCKLCEDIIESLHKTDFVPCSCGEIAIDGGDSSYRAMAKDWSNFLRIDDKDREIVVSVVDDKSVKNQESNGIAESDPKQPSRDELLEELAMMIKNITDLPPNALTLPITHYDLCSALMLVSALFKSDRLS